MQITFKVLCFDDRKVNKKNQQLQKEKLVWVNLMIIKHGHEGCEYVFLIKLCKKITI